MRKTMGGLLGVHHKTKFVSLTSRMCDSQLQSQGFEGLSLYNMLYYAIQYTLSLNSCKFIFVLCI